MRPFGIGYSMQLCSIHGEHGITEPLSIWWLLIEHYSTTAPMCMTISEDFATALLQLARSHDCSILLPVSYMPCWIYWPWGGRSFIFSTWGSNIVVVAVVVVVVYLLLCCCYCCL